MKLAVITAHAGAECLGQALQSWGVKDTDRKWEHKHGFGFPESQPPTFIVNGQTGILPAYQAGFAHVMADVLAYFHDDVIIHRTQRHHRVCGARTRQRGIHR